MMPFRRGHLWPLNLRRTPRVHAFCLLSLLRFLSNIYYRLTIPDILLLSLVHLPPLAYKGKDLCMFYWDVPSA